MLGDPGPLRAASAELARCGQVLEERTAALVAAEDGLRWSAPLVDDVRARLAAGAACGRSAAADLGDGAGSLRLLAQQVDDVRAEALRLHALARARLVAEVAASGPGMEGWIARRALDDLAGAQDPVWSRSVGAPPLPLPGRVVLPARAVPPGPPGQVEADVPAVRAFGAAARATGGFAQDTAVRVRAVVGAQPWGELDRHGLRGSDTGDWLLGLTGPGSALGRAGQLWEEAGRTAELLAGLLEAADRPEHLLADTRLPLALAALGALVEGPVGGRTDAARRLLDGRPAGERAWLLDVVPGLAAAVPARAPAPAAPVWQPGVVDLLDVVNAAVQVPADVAVVLRGRVSELARDAVQLFRSARTLDAPAKAATRAAARDLLATAREVRGQAVQLERIAGWLRVPSWLRSASTSPLVDAPVVRGVSRVGALGASAGVVLDLHDGVAPGLAAAKALSSLAAGLGAVALATAALAALPFVVPELVAAAVLLAVGTVVSVLVAGLVGRWGPDVAHAVAKRVRRLGGWLGGVVHLQDGSGPPRSRPVTGLT